MIAFRGQEKVGPPLRLVSFRGLIQSFGPFHMGVPPGVLNEPGPGTTYDCIGSRDL